MSFKSCSDASEGETEHNTAYISDKKEGTNSTSSEEDEVKKTSSSEEDELKKTS